MKISWLFLKAFLRASMILSPIWLTLAAVISVLGLVIARVEQLPWMDGLYFAWVTGMTVGYGDIAPQQFVSRVLSIVIAINGVVLTGILVAIAVQALRAAVNHAPAFERIRDKLTDHLPPQD